jgi:Rod binding domain-containing protein
MTTIGPVKPPGGTGPDARARLQALSRQLESEFLGQLFQAMRESVPKSGLLGDSPEEKMFGSLLDDAMASRLSEHMRRGLAEAMYRQLARGLEAGGAPDTPRGPSQ